MAAQPPVYGVRDGRDAELDVGEDLCGRHGREVVEEVLHAVDVLRLVPRERCERQHRKDRREDNPSHGTLARAAAVARALLRDPTRPARVHGGAAQARLIRPPPGHSFD